MGATLKCGREGLDEDEFDEFCDHLLVIDTSTDEVVGTYRLLTPASAMQCGRRYCETEFDIRRLKCLQSHTLELGRSCVRADKRGSLVMGMLWSGIGAYLRVGGYRYVMGCVSVSLSEGPEFASDLFQSLRPNMVLPSLTAFPRTPLAVDVFATGKAALPPTLMRAYLKAGAQVAGVPAVDRDFDCADFLMLLSVDQMQDRFARRFQAGQVTAADQVA
jgi:putative hemolysin